jgi:hypothetical protein
MGLHERKHSRNLVELKLNITADILPMALQAVSMEKLYSAQCNFAGACFQILVTRCILYKIRGFHGGDY